MLAGSYWHLDRPAEAASARTKLLAAFPNVSAERMLNEDYAFAREADEVFFADTFKLLELPACLSAAEVMQMGARHLLPACEQERARTAAVKS